MLALGGALYCAGAVVYAIKRPRLWPKVFGFHEVFHILVTQRPASTSSSSSRPWHCKADKPRTSLTVIAPTAVALGSGRSLDGARTPLLPLRLAHLGEILVDQAAPTCRIRDGATTWYAGSSGSGRTDEAIVDVDLDAVDEVDESIRVTVEEDPNHLALRFPWAELGGGDVRDLRERGTSRTQRDPDLRAQFEQFDQGVHGIEGAEMTWPGESTLACPMPWMLTPANVEARSTEAGSPGVEPKVPPSLRTRSLIHIGAAAGASTSGV